MSVWKQSVLAAGLVGSALVLSGAVSASAASLAPALALAGETAGVQHVTHDPLARPGPYYGQRFAQRNYSGYASPRGYYRPGPVIGFGFGGPRFGVGVGPGYYGWRQPWDYGYGPYGNSVGYTGY